MTFLPLVSRAEKLKPVFSRARIHFNDIYRKFMYRA